MKEILKNLIHYIKCLINGDEYISDKTKFAYTLYTVSFIHVCIAVIFACFGIVWLVIYNIVAVFFYQGLVTLSNKKKYILTTSLAISEIMLHIILVSLMIGNRMGFNLYCMAIIPAAFYTSYSIKSFKRSTIWSFILSVLAMITFAASCILEVKYTPLLLLEEGVGVHLVYIFNSVITFSMMIIFSLLFSWEIRSNTVMLEKRNNQLSQFANRDPLTKLANRRSMMEHLNLSMHKMQLDQTPFSVILGDIDDFKKINDSYGHDCGDKVLVAVAKIITSQMREGDFVCRWGGEEILITINGDLECAAAIAERIRTSIASTEIQNNNDKVHITMTYGVAQSVIGYRLEQLITQADNKLYYGKGHGKNQVVTQIPSNY